jgi:HSP20 family molecular chaperone IbpA
MFGNSNNLRDLMEIINKNYPLTWTTSKEYKRPNRPTVDIEARQVENGFEVEIVMPGYEKDQIKVEGDSTTLKVFSEGKNKRGESFSQLIAIPDYCQVHNITAEYKNGILTIFFPVLEEDENSKIYINVK